MSVEAVNAHALRHGFPSPLRQNDRDVAKFVTGKEFGPPKRERMNKTESEFSHILQSQLSRGEIADWRFQGVTLRWGMDPATGRQMRYTADFVVTKIVPMQCESCGKVQPTSLTYYRILEIKGPFIRDRDLVRFRGCRSFWPEFAFELHQRTKEGWKRLE